jgi:hypothetical protein
MIEWLRDMRRGLGQDEAKLGSSCFVFCARSLLQTDFKPVARWVQFSAFLGREQCSLSYMYFKSLAGHPLQRQQSHGRHPRRQWN